MVQYICKFYLVCIRFFYHVLWIMLAFYGRWFSYMGNAYHSTRHCRHCRGVSRTLTYCDVSPSFGRCLGYPLCSLENRVPFMVPDHSDISS